MNYSGPENESDVDNDTMEGMMLEPYPNPFDHTSVRVTFIAIYSVVFFACILVDSLSFVAPTFVVPSFVAPTCTDPTFVVPSFVAPTCTDPSFVDPTFVVPFYSDPA
ncbi:hypothetical protein LSAT2_026004 [Lamellibrachia satsuma]|nr:hypothetical protein LSAT2_026004 [Lamellibrachia satsuma]